MKEVVCKLVPGTSSLSIFIYHIYTTFSQLTLFLYLSVDHIPTTSLQVNIYLNKPCCLKTENLKLESDNLNMNMKVMPVVMISSFLYFIVNSFHYIISLPFQNGYHLPTVSLKYQ